MLVSKVFVGLKNNNYKIVGSFLIWSVDSAHVNAQAGAWGNTIGRPSPSTWMNLIGIIKFNVHVQVTRLE